MKNCKLFYIFKDPMGAKENKIGITGHPQVRLGTYQNSYSKKSHTACFDVVYFGPDGAIKQLEKEIKNVFDWQIERDGRGHSEWVSENLETIESKIDELIDGFRFKITKLPKKFLPVTVENWFEVEEYISMQSYRKT